MSNDHHRSQRGQAIILITFSAIMLCAVLGLVVDIGWAYFRRQAIHAAIDSAALAAAQAALGNTGTSFSCGSNGITCTTTDTPCSSTPNTTPPLSTADVACLYAQSNGFTTGGTGVAMLLPGFPQTVSYTCGTSTPPPTVPGACVSYWFTVRAREPQPQLFSAVLGNTVLGVSARATAAVVGTGLGGCIYVLDPSADKALFSNGGSDLEAPCGIWVNSSANDAIFQTSGSTINATPGLIQVVGGVKQTGHAVMTPNATTGISSFADPLASMHEPAVPSNCDYTNLKMTHSGTLNPGTYCGGITLSGNDSSPVTFNPGLYVILGGGISMTGGLGATGTNVTFYLTGNGTYAYSGVKIDGTGNYSFTAPTSGPRESMLFVKDRTQPAAGGSTMTGNSAMNMTGIIYLPNEDLTFSGGAGASSAYTMIVCDTLKINGIAYLNTNYTTLSGCVPGPRVARLIE